MFQSSIMTLENMLFDNGEMAKNKVVCDLEVIEMIGYDRRKICLKKPSPNLPNEKSIISIHHYVFLNKHL